MTSHTHDTPLKLCRERPEFATELARHLLDIELPDYDEVLPYSESATDIEVRDLNCDNVAVCRQGGENRMGIIVEVQREKSEGKLWSWPTYVADIRHRISAPVLLIAICPQPAVADWARESILLGPGSIVTPMVIGPEEVPKLTESSGTGELAEAFVMAALMHGHSADRREIFQAARKELSYLQQEKGALYAQFILAFLDEEGREFLEALMEQDTYLYEERLLPKREARAEARGEVLGLREGLLLILENKGIGLTAAQRERVEDCTDTATLKQWLVRASEAQNALGVFH